LSIKNRTPQAYKLTILGKIGRAGKAKVRIKRACKMKKTQKNVKNLQKFRNYVFHKDFSSDNP
jgi:hypothetical protein